MDEGGENKKADRHREGRKIISPPLYSGRINSTP